MIPSKKAGRSDDATLPAPFLGSSRRPLPGPAPACLPDIIPTSLVHAFICASVARSRRSKSQDSNHCHHDQTEQDDLCPREQQSIPRGTFIRFHDRLPPRLVNCGHTRCSESTHTVLDFSLTATRLGVYKSTLPVALLRNPRMSIAVGYTRHMNRGMVRLAGTGHDSHLSDQYRPAPAGSTSPRVLIQSDGISARFAWTTKIHRESSPFFELKNGVGDRCPVPSLSSRPQDSTESNPLAPRHWREAGNKLHDLPHSLVKTCRQTALGCINLVCPTVNLGSCGLMITAAL
ncbi:hypothetical protein QBC47DRAFT_138295 [Echria macrotheca]|uniref:Uncharacterized protein n=1 Tax=Echria macrotheca TaxID=438768 RepID=A0AAJ0FEP1_9PEZI|nr:hypothetical protein QBC47DRAFT_138295 [Echria macrotheca]